jgi:pimeloyl-ACP methyl ester carboxylesterase
MASLQYTLPSGRTLGVTGFGNPMASHVVIFCHPAPGSGLFDPAPALTSGRDVHVIAIDRPGYGSSEPLPDDQWPTIAGIVDDISEFVLHSEHIAQSLNLHDLDSLGVAGWSAGGRIALALAARHPQLFTRVATVGTPAPNEDVHWIPDEFQSVSDQLASRPAADAMERLTTMLAAQGGPVTDDVDRASEWDTSWAMQHQLGVGDADAAVLAQPGVRDRLEAMLRDAYRQGVTGVATDLLSYTARPWQIDYDHITARALLLYGEHDQIGREHAQWYASKLATAQVEEVPGVGHLAIVPAWERIIDHLTDES